MNTRTAILLEMLGLWVGTIFIFKHYNKDVDIPNLMINVALPSGIPILVITALLLGADELTNSNIPALFGLLIAGGALMVEGTVAAEAFNELIQTYSVFAIRAQRTAIKGK